MCIKSVLSIISNLVEIDPKRLVKYRTYKNMSLLTHNSNTSVSYIHLLEFESKRKRERAENRKIFYSHDKIYHKSRTTF